MYIYRYLCVYLDIYMYIYVYIFICIDIYIYLYLSGDREKERERLRNWLMQLVGPGWGKCEICRAAWQAGDPGENWVQSPSPGRVPSSSENLSLFLLRPSTDWMRPIDDREGILLYSKSIDLNVNLISKRPSQRYLDWVWPNSRIPLPS